MENPSTIITYQEYISAMEIVLSYQKQISNSHEEIIKDANHDLLEKNVENLYFSERVMGTFYSMEIYKVRDILNYTERDFKKRRNFGPKSLKEIKSELGKLGLSLNR